MKGSRIIANALLWATVIIVIASTLQGSGYLQQVLPILGGGATVSLLLTIQPKNK